jgi:hypothetical protein
LIFEIVLKCVDFATVFHVKVQCSVDVCGFVFVLYIWAGLNGKCICLNELEF